MSNTAVFWSNLCVGLLTVIAIVGGPIVALWIQARSDEGRQAKHRKLWVFKTLMTYRATPLAPAFVQALNTIDVEFSSDSKADKAVRASWRELLDCLSPEAPQDNAFEVRQEKTAALLSAMGQRLGFDFDKVHIKKQSYIPQAHVNLEEEQQALRHKLLDVLDGKARIPVAVLEQTFPDIVEPKKPKTLAATTRNID